MLFDPELEPEARNLFELACCGSRELWPSLASGISAADPALRDTFYALANKGMFEAQQIIVNKLTSSEPVKQSAKVLYRAVCDAMAWQFLGHQLCHARRLYKGHEQPSLTENNLSSLLLAVEQLRKSSPHAMPLISDLTSFVQVGDIFLSDPKKGFSFIEVKEGRENARIMDLVRFYRESGCEQFREIISSTESKHVAKQFERNIRQYGRMDHIAEIMNKGDSVDPDTGNRHFIPEDEIETATWDGELNAVIDEARSKGWALQVIDGGLFVACYVEENFRRAGHVLFNSWLDRFGGDARSPRSTLIQAMAVPLALPLFNRGLAPDTVFDIMFGRMQVCMGVSVPAFLERCVRAGMGTRPATRKERGELMKPGAGAVLFEDKPVFLSRGDAEMPLLDGIFFRSLFHGQKPISLIETYLNHLPSLDPTAR